MANQLNIVIFLFNAACNLMLLQQLSQILLQALLSFKDYEAYTLSVQVCAEILEMPQNQYAKQSIQY